MEKTISVTDLVRNVRPGWQAALRRSRQDVAAGCGKDLESIVKELGLEDPPHRKPSSAHRTKSRARMR